MYREEVEITTEPPIVFGRGLASRANICAIIFRGPDADEEAARVPNMSNPVGNTVEKFRSRPVESRRGGERGNGTERARARIRAHDLIIFIQPRCSMAGLNIAARPLPLHPVTLQIVGLFRVERAAGGGGSAALFEIRTGDISTPVLRTIYL